MQKGQGSLEFLILIGAALVVAATVVVVLLNVSNASSGGANSSYSGIRPLAVKKMIAGDNLVLYWNFDDGSGTTVKDSTKFGYNGVTANSAWVDGKYGKALSFNGTSSSYAWTLGDVGSLPLGNSPRTIAAWVNPAVVPGPQEGTIVTTGSNSCPDVLFGLSPRNGSGYFALWAGCDDPSSTLSIPVGKWSFVAITYDGAGNATFWVDKASQTVPLVAPHTALNTPASRVFVGYSTHTNNSGGYRGSFNGSIDEVMIFNKALSSSDIASIRGT